MLGTLLPTQRLPEIKMNSTRHAVTLHLTSVWLFHAGLSMVCSHTLPEIQTVRRSSSTPLLIYVLQLNLASNNMATSTSITPQQTGARALSCHTQLGKDWSFFKVVKLLDDDDTKELKDCDRHGGITDLPLVLFPLAWIIYSSNLK